MMNHSKFFEIVDADVISEGSKVIITDAFLNGFLRMDHISRF